MIRKVLWISAILTVIALIPGAIVLGLFLGILPGLILAAAPTVFLYAVAFEVLRIALRPRLPTRAPVVINAVAAGLTLALGCALAAPFALHGRRAFAAAARDDVTHPGPVRLEGDVRLDRFGHTWSSMSQAKKVECDALCAALLDTPGVRSVTIGGTGPSGESVRPVTYRLIAKHQARGATLMPAEPGKIVEHLPDPDRGKTGGGPKWKEALEARKALADFVTATWALRLGGAESLVAEPPPPTFERTISIRDVRGQGMHRIGVTEVEIADPDGRLLMRRRRVTAAPVAAPVHLTPVDLMHEGGFEIGRGEMHTGPRYFDFKPLEALFRDTTLARPVADDRVVARLRETLAASIGSSTLAEHSVMVAPWLATLDWQRLNERDVDVLAKLIADPRSTGLERIYDGSARNVSPRLRHAIAVRLLEPATDDRLRSTLNTLVRNMPVGTYAELLPEEDALLADPALRLRSSALVARLADQGAAAVPRLIQLLTESVRVQSWAKRQWILADIRRALSRLGRDAASALPAVERLFDMPGSPLTNSSNDANAWRVAMVRMGKPVETLTFPPRASPESVARDREQIRKQAEKGPEF